MVNRLTTDRILSIDALRGITILTMIFVNELAGADGIPVWMKHMPADADAMTFVDVVFPAFLFIVGMSIPFAIANRRKKGDTTLQLQGHIIFRTIGLLVLGVFMVNAEDDYNESAMGMSIHLWSLLFLLSAMLVWNVYSFQNKMIAYILRGVGIIGLIALASIYRGGDGTEMIQPRWWGILGLIGWAYFISCCIYQLVRGRTIALMVFAGLGTAYYAIGKMESVQSNSLGWIFSQGGHATHTTIVICGIILSLIFFDEMMTKSIKRRFIEAMLFAIVLLVVGFALRPFYTISKIYATPTWGLYSAASCCLLFTLLYWLIDIKRLSSWTKFFKPAASNPLLTYIIPSIIFALMQLLDISWPSLFYQGIAAVIWSAVFALLVMSSVVVLNKLRIRLQL